jgi:hypothetical protein
LGAGLSAFGWAVGTWLSDIAYLAQGADQPMWEVLGTIGVGGSFVLAIRAAEVMDILFLGIAVYEGYKFSDGSRSVKD